MLASKMKLWYAEPAKLWQHRTIWQEAPAWIFGSIQSLENEGIPYVFPVFQTEEVGQKDGCGSQTQLRGVALKKKFQFLEPSLKDAGHLRSTGDALLLKGLFALCAAPMITVICRQPSAHRAGSR